MNIAIRGVGICTSKICNVEDFCDQLLEEGRFHKKEEKIIDTLQQAVREAKAIDLPLIQVSAKEKAGISLYKALSEAETMPQAAIICTQENEFGYEDTAVLVTSTIPEDKAWARITGIDQGKGKPSMAARVYQARGPVQEACSVIAECAALRYGLPFGSLEVGEEYRRIFEKDTSDHRVSIHGGQLMLEEVQNVDEDSVPISKHLVPVSFAEKEELLEKLSQLVQLIHRLSLYDISKNVRKGFFERKERRKTVVLAARDSEELLQEIEAFLKVQSFWEMEGYVWKTKAGSFYTATPLKEGNKVCIVNPPANMFSRLLFYRMYRALPMVKKCMPECLPLGENKQPLITWYVFESWTRKFATLALKILGIGYDQAVGMGLGELSLPFVLDYMTVDTGLALEETISLLEKLLLCRPELVERYLKNMPEGAVENWYVMCEEEKAQAEARRMRERHLQVREGLEYAVYSTSLLRKLKEGSLSVAEALVGSITKQVDFPLIIRQIYRQGGRVFVTLGSGGRSRQWISECLQDKKDVLVTSLFEEESPTDSLPLLLAQFMSYGIPIDYKKFYATLSWNQEQESEEELRAKLMEHLLNCNQEAHSHYKSVSQTIDQDASSDQEAELSSMQYRVKEAYLYGKNEILEMTGGLMSNILGSQYGEIDHYEVRERMPLPPFLFVSGITKIVAQYRKFEAGSYIEGEFCITKDTVLLANHTVVSNAVLVEAAHIGRFLMAYMGIDEASHGNARYEVNEIIEEYYGEEWPEVGDTVKLHYTIDRFEKRSDMMYVYATYVIQYKGKPLIESKIKGRFYNQKHRRQGKGLEGSERPEVMLGSRCAIYHPLSGRHQFTKNQIRQFISGNLSACFNKEVTHAPLMYWSGKAEPLIDRVLDISSEGGSFGYGYILTEKTIGEAFWPFAAHFKNNPVLPGTIMMEMLTQTIIFFATYMGLHKSNTEGVPNMAKNHPTRVRFGGEVLKGDHTLIIKVEPRKVEQVEDEIILIYDGAVYCDGMQVLKQDGNALWIDT